MTASFDWLLHRYLPDLAEAFVDPRKRVSLLYLVTALCIALGWSAWASREGWKTGLRTGFRIFLSPSVWTSRSARADYGLMLINRAVMMLLAPALLSRLAVATFLFYVLHDAFGAGPAALRDLPPWVAPVAFTVVLFLLDDFSRYAVHRALHRIPLLWAFHRTHHSAEVLTPFTVYRTHPVEGILFALRGSLVQALAISLFVFLFGRSIDLVSVFGVNVLLFVFNATGANLRHSHVPIAYGARLEHLFISPLQHQVHHSVDPRHHDRNFGAALAVWDWIGGTLCLSGAARDLRFGVTDRAPGKTHGLVALYVAPFYEVYYMMRSALRSAREKAIMRPVTAGFHRTLTRGLLPVLAAAALAALLAPAGRVQAQELNVYSHRQPFLITPFLAAFEKKTGIKVNVVFSAQGLVQRMLAEGARSPADVVLTVDIARLYAYADKGLLAPVESKVLAANIPPHLRDRDNRWFGFSKRARVVATSRDRVAADAIKRVEDLADPKWKGRVCTRPGSHVYNRALLASMIAAHGEKAAEDWARGLVANLARRPQGDDRAQVKAVFEGVCDIAVINSYYYGKLRTSEIPAQRNWAAAVRIVFTNQQDRGNHMNISGGGVAKYSKHREAAIKLLEFLSGDEAQRLYSDINDEYPANPRVKPGDEVASWGSFKEDSLPIGRIAELAPAAQRIIDRVGW